MVVKAARARKEEINNQRGGLVPLEKTRARRNGLTSSLKPKAEGTCRLLSSLRRSTGTVSAHRERLLNVVVEELRKRKGGRVSLGGTRANERRRHEKELTPEHYDGGRE